MVGNINSRSRVIRNVFLYGVVMLFVVAQVAATLHKPANKKIKRDKLPDRIAYNNKNMPADCEVCKLLVNEVENIINDDNKPLNEEEEKKRKREERRKGKEKISDEEKLNKFEEKLKKICKTMRKYLPQNDLTKFRYISRETLLETASLTVAATEPSKEKQVKHEYESLVHPETKRLESRCRIMLKKHLKDIMRWKRKGSTDSIQLVDYLCNDTVLKNDTKLSNCLTKGKVDDKLWGNTFEHLIPYHKSMMPDEL